MVYNTQNYWVLVSVHQHSASIAIPVNVAEASLGRQTSSHGAP
jgi:hypothetical protein